MCLWIMPDLHYGIVITTTFLLPPYVIKKEKKKEAGVYKNISDSKQTITHP